MYSVAFQGIARLLPCPARLPPVHPQLNGFCESKPFFSVVNIACEQALHLGDIVKSTRARGTREETRLRGAAPRGSLRSPKQESLLAGYSKQNAWHTNLVVNDIQLTTALLTSEWFPHGQWFDYHQRRKCFCLINVTCLSIIYWTLILWLVPREKLNSPGRKTFHVYQFTKVNLSERPSLAKTRAPTDSDVRDFAKLLA